MSDLYARQVKLKEIGPTGQARIKDAVIRIADVAGSPTASEYLRRSGVGVVIIDEHEPATEFPHAHHFQFDTCRTFAAGAWMATQRIARVLGL